MKKVMIFNWVTFILLMISCVSQKRGQNHQGLQEYSFQWDEYERSYFTYLPKSVESKSNIPVLFVLHGGSGTAAGMPKFTKNRFQELADKDGFIVVFPQGIDKQWNDGRDPKQYPNIRRQKPWVENLNDVGFLVEILKTLKNDYDIDKNKVFTCGISNGGFMSNRLICDRPDVFKGAGVVTATMDHSFVERCNPDIPVSLIIMNGTMDEAVPFEGGKMRVFGSLRGDVLSLEEYVDFWRSKNNCGYIHPAFNIRDKDTDGTSVIMQKYSDCDNRNEIKVYTIVGGGHTWPGARSPLYERIAGKTTMEINACDEIWNFFKSI